MITALSRGLSLRRTSIIKVMNPETIRALTPVFLATIGGVMGIAVLVTPNLGEAKWSAGFGLAGTAIAGAAGLAQSTKNESTISAGENSRIIQAQDNPAQPSETR